MEKRKSAYADSIYEMYQRGSKKEGKARKVEKRKARRAVKRIARHATPKAKIEKDEGYKIVNNRKVVPGGYRVDSETDINGFLKNRVEPSPTIEVVKQIEKKQPEKVVEVIKIPEQPKVEVKSYHINKPSAKTARGATYLRLKTSEGELSHYAFKDPAKRRSFINKYMMKSTPDSSKAYTLLLKEYGAEPIAKELYETNKHATKISLNTPTEVIKEMAENDLEDKWNKLLTRGGRIEIAEKEENIMPQVVEEVGAYVSPEVYSAGDTTAMYKLGSFNENAVNVLADYEKRGLIEVL